MSTVNLLANTPNASLARMKINFGHAHITEADYKAMAAQTSRLHHRLLLRFLWIFGLRVSEVLDIRVRDIDLDKEMVTVKRLKKKRPTIDELPIPQELIPELREALRNNGGTRRIIPITRQAAAKVVRVLARKAGIDVKGGDPNRQKSRQMHCHAFRHGRVYDLIMKGVSPLLVARILGHADLSTLMTYFHPRPEDIKATLEL